MSSRRLTNELRDAIAAKILDGKLANLKTDIEDPYMAARQQLACAVYDDKYDVVMRRKMHRLPPGWLDTTDSITVAFGGKKIVLHFGPLVNHEYPTKLILDEDNYSSSSYNRKSFMMYDGAHELSERWMEIEKTYETAKTQRNTMQTECRQVLNSVGSSKQLAERWPESIVFMEEVFANLDSNMALLPTASVSALNAKLGL